MIVVDANIIAYYSIEGVKTKLAHKLWKKDNDWRVPSLWQDEFLNILASNERTGNLDITACLSILHIVSNLLANSQEKVDMPLALTLASKYRISAYDAQYLAVAKTIGVSLITEDSKLRKAAPDLTLSMQEFLELE